MIDNLLKYKNFQNLRKIPKKAPVTESFLV